MYRSNRYQRRDLSFTEQKTEPVAPTPYGTFSRSGQLFQRSNHVTRGVWSPVNPTHVVISLWLLYEETANYQLSLTISQRFQCLDCSPPLIYIPTMFYNSNPFLDSHFLSVFIIQYLGLFVNNLLFSLFVQFSF